jgi:hypothetical protein
MNLEGSYRPHAIHVFSASIPLMLLEDTFSEVMLFEVMCFEVMFFEAMWRTHL